MSTSSDPVSFLIAGVQKGGTTTLFGYLAEHPQLLMAACKETHFFDDEVNVDWSAPDYDRYHNFFEAPAGRLRGEATPIYTYWPQSLLRIRAYNPNMRLIILFRDPVMRAWSHWKMEYARGWETEPFTWCIRDGRKRLEQGSPTEGYHRVFSYVERGFYGQQMQSLLDLFPRSHVLPLLSQDLNDAPRQMLKRVYDFLQVTDISEQQGDRRLNAAREFGYGPSISADDIVYLRNVFEDDMSRLQSLTDLKLDAWRRDQSPSLP